MFIHIGEANICREETLKGTGGCVIPSGGLHSDKLAGSNPKLKASC